MIIDSHVHLGEYGVTLDLLLNHMNEPLALAPQVRCDKVVAQNGMVRNPEENKSYEDQMAYLATSVRSNPDRIIGMMTINPYDNCQTAVALAGKYAQQNIIKALKIHPKIHNFRVDEDLKRLAPILECASKHKLLLHIHTGDPFSEPSRIEPLAESYRDVNIVMCHMATQMISYTPEAFVTAKHNPNIYLEIGFHERRLREGVRMIGADRFLFATDTPINDIATGLVLVYSLANKPPFGLGLASGDLEKILSLNAIRLMNLK